VFLASFAGQLLIVLLSAGDDSPQQLVGTAKVKAKLIIAQNELNSANDEFRKALPSIREYKEAEAALEDRVAAKIKAELRELARFRSKCYRTCNIFRGRRDLP
jgi:hypothetical protein